MVDFSFFRSRTFLGANIVAFIVSFAMLAMFFFLALYMQNIRGYSPLQAGVRFLPSTVMIIIIAPLAGRLADRVGSRPLITFGLLCVSGALFWQSHLTVSSGYGSLLPGFMLMGVGMGFVMSPMSLAAMNAVDRTKAGVASGILSMNRMVGGTFGVAILGALVATLGRSKIDQLLPAAARLRALAPRRRARLRRRAARRSRARHRRRAAGLRLRAALRAAARLRRRAARRARRVRADPQALRRAGRADRQAVDRRRPLRRPGASPGRGSGTRSRHPARRRRAQSACASRRRSAPSTRDRPKPVPSDGFLATLTTRSRPVRGATGCEHAAGIARTMLSIGARSRQLERDTPDPVA